MAIWSRRRQPPVIVGSAERLTGDQRSRSAPGRRVTADGTDAKTAWTTVAWEHYDGNGVVWYPVQFYGKLLSRLRLYIATGTPEDPQEIHLLDETGAPTQGLPVGADVAVEALERVRDSAGGTSTLLGRYGQLMFATGDARLAVSWLPPADAPVGYTAPIDAPEVVESWEVLSSDELRRKDESTGRGSKWVRKRSAAGEEEEFVDLDENPGATVSVTGTTDKRKAIGVVQVYRFWRPHPRYSGDADSPLRAALAEAEELAMLSRAVRARGRQRATGAGILKLPDDIKAHPKDPRINHADPLSDPVLDDIIEGLYAGYADEDDPANLVPVIIRGPRDSLDAMSVLFLHEEGDKYPEAALRRETLERYAIELDMPKERLLGTGDINHWGAWAISADEWNGHGAPIARMLCEDWTTGYLRPTLAAPSAENGGGLTQDQADAFFVWYDASSIIVPADRTKDANEAHDRGTINDNAHRRAGGWADTDAPAPGAPNSNPAVVARFGKAFEGQTTVEAPAAAPAPVAPGAADPGAQDVADAEAAPPPAVAGAASHGELVMDLARLNGSTAPLLLGAAVAAVYRMREAAGAKLRTRARNGKTLAAIKRRVEVDLRDVPSAHLAAHLGTDTASSLAGIDELFAGADEPLVAVLEQLSVPPLIAAQVRGAARDWARTTLYVTHIGDPPAILAEACRAAATASQEARA